MHAATYGNMSNLVDVGLHLKDALMAEGEVPGQPPGVAGVLLHLPRRRLPPHVAQAGVAEGLEVGGELPSAGCPAPRPLEHVLDPAPQPFLLAVAVLVRRWRGRGALLLDGDVAEGHQILLAWHFWAGYNRVGHSARGLIVCYEQQPLWQRRVSRSQPEKVGVVTSDSAVILTLAEVREYFSPCLYSSSRNFKGESHLRILSSPFPSLHRAAFKPAYVFDRQQVPSSGGTGGLRALHSNLSIYPSPGFTGRQYRTPTTAYV